MSATVASTSLEHLFKPITIGNVEMPNRICFSGHSSMMVDRGLPTEQQLRYYEERAKGGAGWVVIGASVAHESSMDRHTTNLVSDPDAVPGYRRIVDAVHAHGAKISTQMDHWGSALGYPRRSRWPLFSPSGLSDTGGLERTKALEPEDMELLMQASEQAAANAKEAGFDGVELLASMGFSLIQAFLSPRINKRTDEYGGSLENRMRFPLQLIERIRAVTGTDMLLGVKLVSDELLDGGLTAEDIKEIAARLTATGNVDYLHMCLGTMMDESLFVPEMDFAPGFAAPLAGGVRETVDVPVLAVKRINDPLMANRIIGEGQADLVAMARALIADPELPNKAREGRLDDIRQCTGSNQECVGRTMHSLPIGCIHNPAVGNEEKWGIGLTRPAERRRRILVVGGGPAGMKAAEIAAERGHEVRLLEREQELGGQVRWITSVNSRKDYESVIRYLVHRMSRLGVQVETGIEATADLVLAADADAVLIATGARPDRSGFSASAPFVETMPGTDQDNVFTVFDVFGADPDLGSSVLVVDEFGDAESTMIGEYLADRGKQVEIVSRQPYVGMKLGEWWAYTPMLQRLTERNIVCTGFTGISGIDGNVVRGRHELTGEPFERTVDSVVLAMGKLPADELYFELKGRVPELYRLGDCVAARRITDAIYEGQVLGHQL